MVQPPAPAPTQLSELTALLAQERTRSAALQEQVDTYEQILDSIADMILVKGEKSRILWANKAFRDYYAMSQAQIRDMIDAPFNEPDYTLQYIRDDAQVFSTGETLHIEEPVTRHDGVIGVFSTVKSAIRDGEGQVIKTVGVSRDITEQRNAEAERLRLQEQVIQAQEAALAELSTPLIPITNEVLVMPLIGSLDSHRAARVIETLLEGVAAQRAQVAILDITGVSIVDTQVADALVRAARAVRLLGARVVLTGIRPEVAQTLVQLGVELGDIVTRGTLQDGITYATR